MIRLCIICLDYIPLSQLICRGCSDKAPRAPRQIIDIHKGDMVKISLGYYEGPIYGRFHFIFRQDRTYYVTILTDDNRVFRFAEKLVSVSKL